MNSLRIGIVSLLLASAFAHTSDRKTGPKEAFFGTGFTTVGAWGWGREYLDSKKWTKFGADPFTWRTPAIRNADWRRNVYWRAPYIGSTAFGMYLLSSYYTNNMNPVRNNYYPTKK